MPTQKIYKAKRKGLIHFILLGFILLIVLVPLLNIQAFSERPTLLFPLVSPLMLILWIYFDTSYKLQEGTLYYKSAFIKGQIGVDAIREIKKGVTQWVGVKPALSGGGLLIKYNQYDEVYIAPKNNDELIADLKEIKEGIIISG